MAYDDGSVLSLAAQIVSAHVANNAVAPDDLPKLINDVHHALANAGLIAAKPPTPEPAVDVKKSVRADKIVCLDCGKSFSMIKRHIFHGSQTQPGRVPPEMGFAGVLPHGGTELRQGPFGIGQEDRLGAQGIAHENRPEEGAQNSRPVSGFAGAIAPPRMMMEASRV